MATARASALYTAAYTNKYLVGAGSPGGQGRVVPIPFELTVASVAATGDTYQLCVIPAGYVVVGLACVGSGIGLSAGGGRTFSLGDSGSAVRFMLATDFDVVDAHDAGLPYAGQNFSAAVDTIVLGTFTGVPTVGGLVKGCFLCIPSA